VRLISRFLFTVLLALVVNASLSSAQPTIHILKVRESQGWWTVPELLARRLREYLDNAAKDLSLVFDVKVIESIEEWERLMDESPPNMMIINAHGELVPVPPKYGTDWQSFYRDLAMNIVYKGWVFVNPIGYGFYYVTYNYTKRPDGTWGWTLITVGPAGLDVLGGWLGIVATAWPGAVGGTPKLTDLGKHVFDVLGYEMPETANAPRPITTNVPASWYFYVLEGGNVTAYACAAFEIGKGALLWGGWSSQPVEEQARVAVAMVLYHLFPSEIEAAQPKPKPIPLLKPEFMVLVAWGAIAVIMVFVLLKASKKERF